MRRTPAPRARSRRGARRTFHPGPVSQSRFDRDAIAEIIQNLVDNAEKYSRTARTGRFEVALFPADHSVTLSVRDHGPGIPADVREKLFRPFARGNRDDAPAGLGLGLVLVKALAEAHGGRVAMPPAVARYADAPGGGALFTVRSSRERRSFTSIFRNPAPNRYRWT
jgi:signal transduction histidine kinase